MQGFVRIASKLAEQCRLIHFRASIPTSTPVIGSPKTFARAVAVVPPAGFFHYSGPPGESGDAQSRSDTPTRGDSDAESKHLSHYDLGGQEPKQTGSESPRPPNDPTSVSKMATSSSSPGGGQTTATGSSGSADPFPTKESILKKIEDLGYQPPDLNVRANGPTNPQSHIRLFGEKESDVRVTLFRDHHAWCPYCQKVWLWLEEHKIPFRVQKITMFCYGQKEKWYLEKVTPRGMLPAVAIDGRVVTESDDILCELEAKFGALNGYSMRDVEVVKVRKIERQLFRCWCQWLCYESESAEEEEYNKSEFVKMAKVVEDWLNYDAGTQTAKGSHSGSTPGANAGSSASPYFLDNFGTADVIFVPYLERMSASLFYYKNYNLRKEHPAIGRWFDAMETRECYRGTQSSFHTHAHDLPPQMGGCHFSNSWDGSRTAAAYDSRSGTSGAGKADLFRSARLVDHGPFLVNESDGSPLSGGMSDMIPEVNPLSHPEPEFSKEAAAYRICKFWDAAKCVRVSPFGPKAFDLGMPGALHYLLTGEVVIAKEIRDGGNPKLSQDVALSLIHVRSHLNVPRDMNVWSCRRMRQALTDYAHAVIAEGGEAAKGCENRVVRLGLRDRRDQDPQNFFSADLQKTPEWMR